MISYRSALKAGVFLVVVGFAHTAAYGKDDRTIFQKCDKNGDGKLDDQEFYVYSLHTGKGAAYWEAVDPTYQGVVDTKARENFENNSRQAAKQQVERERLTPDDTRRSQSRISELYPSGEPTAINPRKQLLGFEIARTYDQVTVDPSQLNSVAAANKAFSLAQPAIFSYQRDFLNNADTWQASGVIAYPIKLASEFWLAPSVEVERVGTRIKKDQKDSVVFRLQWEKVVPNLLFTRSTTFRSNVLYNTNTGFDQEVLGGEFDVQPTTGIWGNERFDYHIPGIKWTWNGFLHLEGGKDLQHSSSTSSADFLRFGPKGVLTAFLLLNPGDLDADINNRVEITVNYSYFGAFETAADAWLLRTQLIAYLDREHHFSITGEYNDGYAPLTNARSDTFLLSLGVKF